MVDVPHRLAVAEQECVAAISKGHGGGDVEKMEHTGKLDGGGWIEGQDNLDSCQARR